MVKALDTQRKSTSRQSLLKEGKKAAMIAAFLEGYFEGYAEGYVEGAREEVRKLLLLQGTQRFGFPDLRSFATLAALNDLDRLEAMCLRLLTVNSWKELVGPPPSRRGLLRKKP